MFLTQLSIKLRVVPFACIISACVTAPQTAVAESLQSYIASELHTSEQDIATAAASTRNNKKIEIAYVFDRRRCGTGGCNLLIVEQVASHYRIIGRTTTVHTPITFLGNDSSGYPILGVWVAGGGIQEGYQAVLKRHRGVYPSSPFENGVKKNKTVKGRVLIGKMF